MWQVLHTVASSTLRKPNALHKVHGRVLRPPHEGQGSSAGCCCCCGEAREARGWRGVEEGMEGRDGDEEEHRKEEKELGCKLTRMAPRRTGIGDSANAMAEGLKAGRVRSGKWSGPTPRSRCNVVVMCG